MKFPSDKILEIIRQHKSKYQISLSIYSTRILKKKITFYDLEYIYLVRYFLKRGCLDKLLEADGRLYSM
jgi:hypothetical protein